MRIMIHVGGSDRSCNTHLQVEEESDPLVVLVVLGVVLAVWAMYVGVGYARVRDLLAHFCAGEGGDREGRVDPTVGIHYTGIHSLHDTVDGVAEVLFLRDEKTECHQKEHGTLVVQPEDVVVDANSVDLEQTAY